MILLRHPTPDVAPGTCYGRLDIGVAKGAGREIARALDRLGPVTRLYSSPARRCTALSGAIGRARGVEVVADARLLELDFGDWEGRLWRGIDRAETDLWTSDSFNRRPPGGESFAELSARVRAALTEIGDDAVVVTHAGPIRAAWMMCFGRDFKRVFADPVPYAHPIPVPLPTPAHPPARREAV